MQRDDPPKPRCCWVRSPQSGSGTGGNAPETAFAPLILGNRAFERRLVELRPVNRHEHEFAVSSLPQQKVRQALLTAGADNEIRIGNPRRVETLVEHLVVDRVWRDPPGSNILRDVARRTHNLVAAAVVESDHQSEAG